MIPISQVYYLYRFIDCYISYIFMYTCTGVHVYICTYVNQVQRINYRGLHMHVCIYLHNIYITVHYSALYVLQTHTNRCINHVYMYVCLHAFVQLADATKLIREQMQST